MKKLFKIMIPWNLWNHMKFWRYRGERFAVVDPDIFQRGPSWGCRGRKSIVGYRKGSWTKCPKNWIKMSNVQMPTCIATANRSFTMRQHDFFQLSAESVVGGRNSVSAKRNHSPFLALESATGLNPYHLDLGTPMPMISVKRLPSSSKHIRIYSLISNDFVKSGE